ncbi:MAG: peptidase S15 [uncultured bacterium]|nr:MAG: peptidase S15 [uncultured bacterium]
MNIMKIVFLILLFLFVTSLMGFYLAIRPFRIISSLTPASFKIPYENITLHTKDHVKLRAWFIPSKHPHAKTIILLHGYPADKGNILPSRLFLLKNFNLFFLDFRYFGESEGFYTSIGKQEVLDLEAAITYLHSRGIDSVGVWGFSLGGSVAIMTAAKMPEIKAIVAESAYANLYQMTQSYYHIPLLNYPLAELTRLWGILFLRQDVKDVLPEQAATQLHIPILLLHSRTDNVISFQHAAALEKALSHNPKAEMHFTDNLYHGEPTKNYQQLVEDFFQKNLK